MANRWVYKEDGSKQCEAGTGIPLDAMRQELASLVGETNVLAQEERQYPGVIIRLCGAPTGRVNAYQITEEGLDVLFRGIVGPSGFKLWLWPEGSQRLSGADEDYPDAHFPMALLTAREGDSGERALVSLAAMLTEVGVAPTTLGELKGRLCRVYTTGDALTLDLIPSRVNIELGSDRRIVSIWFG